MMDYIRLVNSIGKKIFVNYYYEFKDKSIDKKQLAEKLLSENPNATKIGGQYTRISCETVYLQTIGKKMYYD